MSFTTASIHLPALRHNLGVVHRAAPGRKVMAMVKANAYGHGMLDCAHTLAAAEGFAVAHHAEGVLLRQHFPTHTILVLNPDPAAGWQRYAEAGLAVVIHDTRQAEQLAASRLPAPLAVWLKVDTGLHRLGIAPEGLATVFRQLQESGAVAGITLMTHLACPDETRNPFTARQLEAFHRASYQLDAETSIANSAGILAWPDTHGDWVRPGIMLYGYDPLDHANALSRQLQPVMRLHSRLLAVREVAAGESVGYGAGWTAERPSRIGTIAIGYGDGYPRSAEAGTPVLVDGQEVPLAGRVSMDLITVDLTGHPAIRPGASVELWGEHLDINRVARCANTISYELTTRLTARPLRSVTA